MYSTFRFPITLLIITIDEMEDYTLTYDSNQESQSTSYTVKGTLTLIKNLFLVAKKVLMF